ncbi:hypothetical protein [Mycobacterium rhizamassiliense]|uniref:hypothetical protein n=1 Tax=Mycobacterium rhizamassiliense TaxID=1841860 RepID=UPI00156DE80D|nr:hypothetical protein [Mycobacterium rhizamassiliense]
MSGFVRIEDRLHCIGHVSGILCGKNIRLCSELLNRSYDLRHFRFDRLFRFFDFFDLLIAFLCYIRQRVLEVHHAVVSGAVCSFFGPALVGYFPCLFLAVLKGIAQVVGRVSLLRGERPGQSTVQYIRKVLVRRLDLAPIQLALR